MSDERSGRGIKSSCTFMAVKTTQCGSSVDNLLLLFSLQSQCTWSTFSVKSLKWLLWYFKRRWKFYRGLTRRASARSAYDEKCSRLVLISGSIKSRFESRESLKSLRDSIYVYDPFTTPCDVLLSCFISPRSTRRARRRRRASEKEWKEN